jgi:hypothetical protein
MIAWLRAWAIIAACRPRLAWASSAPVMVGSSSTSSCPASTCWPSWTWIARTTPISSGWTSLTLAIGITLPEATATTSSRPNIDQARAMANRPHRVSIR